MTRSRGAPPRSRRATSQSRWSPGVLAFMVVLQLGLLAFAWYFFDHDHTLSGRIFVAGILLSGFVNLARGVSLVSSTGRRRGGGWRRGAR